MGYCPKKNRNCDNREFVICDTNYFIFIIKYIFYNYIKEDLNNWIKDYTKKNGEKPKHWEIERTKRNLIRTKYIPFNDVGAQFEKFLKQSSECSVNDKINVSKRLFKEELKNLHHVKNPIRKSILSYNKFRGLRSKVADILEKYLDKDEEVDDEDVEDLVLRGKKIFGYKGPTEEDVSLILLGLKKSHNKQYHSLLMTEDSKIELIYNNYIKPKKAFKSHNGPTWNLRKLIIQNSVQFLGNIFRCCERYDLKDILAFYTKFLADLIRKIEYEDTRSAKIRMLTDIASDCSNHINSKSNPTGATP